MSTDKEGTATRGSLRLAPNCVELEVEKAKLPRQFVNFTFYRALPEWRRLADADKKKSKEEFIKTVDEFRGPLLLNSYSTIGLRTNVDFMIWRIGYELDPIQEMTSRINHTQMAKYLEPSQSFLSMTKRSMYIDKDNPDHVEDRRQVRLSFRLPVCENPRVVFAHRRPAPGNDGRTHSHRHQVSFSQTSHHIFFWPGRSGVCRRV